jgi:hypothetical protein
MGPLQLGRTTSLLLSCGVGIFIAKATTSAPLDYQDQQVFVPPVASAVEPALEQAHPLSFDAGRSIAASFLKPTPIAMQPILSGALGGPGPVNADTTGSVAAEAADGGSEAAPTVAAVSPGGKRLLVADATPGATVVAISNASEPVPVPNQSVLNGQRESAAPDQTAERPAPGETKLALATEGPTQDLTPNVTKRQSDADALPPVIIGHTRDDHDGGDIDVFAAKYEKIKKSGRKVVIDGLCFSACTIVASLPKDQVCVTPRASLAVHMATTEDGRLDVEYTQKAVKKYYPPALQEWIKKHGGLEAEPKYVKGDDLLTIFNSCKKGA